MIIKLYDTVEEEREYKYVVIISKHEGQYIFVKHRERETYEIPGGKIEPGETFLQAAHRELFEETGALKYSLEELGDYSITAKGKITFGKIFKAEVKELGKIPNFSEIEKFEIFKDMPEKMTYEVHKDIFQKYKK